MNIVRGLGVANGKQVLFSHLNHFLPRSPLTTTTDDQYLSLLCFNVFHAWIYL